jgi:hypothetical protein
MNIQANAATAKEAMPPESYLLQLAFGALVTQALYVVAKLGVADLLVDKPLSVSKLAEATKTNEQALYRVLRSLASVGVFQETDPQIFALTQYAAPLRSDSPNSFRNAAIFIGEEWHWRVYGNLMHSLKTGKPAWGNVHGVEVFDYFQANPKPSEIFNRAMTDMSASTAPAVVEAYDFSQFERLVDVAGGHGLLLAQILGANPKVKGVLFDVPAVIEGASALLAKEGVADRIECEAGDFFRSVPPNGDAYLLKHIIHDWDDERAIRILQNINAAMKPNGKVLLVELIIPEGNDPHLGKIMDLEMLVSPGGVERTAEEYRTLMAKAGLRLTKVVPTKSAYSIVEAIRMNL